jgi:pimeloyl-ACP methyl ester carboxylesterase
MTRSLITEAVRIDLGPVTLEGDLHVPASQAALVLFAHGSGSSRFSRRNRAVAAALEQAGFATLLLDLLTPEEEIEDDRTSAYRFDIPMLGRRVVGASDWARTHRRLEHLEMVFFGASTGAAAALIAAAARPDMTRAVISRGGRPDLAGDALANVQAPTLLIVGGNDEVVIDLNRKAMARMQAPATLEIVPGATHLFEEPGALEQVAQLAVEWCRNPGTGSAGARPERL